MCASNGAAGFQVGLEVVAIVGVAFERNGTGV